MKSESKISLQARACGMECQRNECLKASRSSARDGIYMYKETEPWRSGRRLVRSSLHVPYMMRGGEGGNRSETSSSPSASRFSEVLRDSLS